MKAESGALQSVSGCNAEALQSVSGALGSAAQGSAALGSAALGSAARGSEALGSAALGSVIIISEPPDVSARIIGIGDRQWISIYRNIRYNWPCIR